LNIFEKALIAKAVATPGTGTPDLSFAISGAQSRYLFPGQQISGYQWDFNNDGIFEESGSDVQHAFGTFAVQNVTLKVTDSAEHSATDTIQVSTQDGNRAPVAAAGGPYQIDAGAQVTLDARTSFDPNQGWGDSIVSYWWDLTGNGIYEVQTNDVLLTLPATVLAGLGLGAGAHPISLKAEDLQGALSNPVFTTLTIVDNSPTANAGPDQVVFNQVILDGSGSSGSNLSYEWQLTHRTNPAYSRTATGVNPVLSNLAPGFYDVVLTVTGDAGSAASKLTLAVVPENVVNDIRAGLFSQQQLDQAVLEERIKWDVNNDGKMGLEEVIYILQKIAGVR
jgi:PKD repeat protein